MATDPHARVLAAHPDLAARWADLVELVWAQGAVDPAVLELCRLRMAQLFGVEWAQRYRTPAALAAGLDPALAARVDAWPTDPGFDELARGCLEVAEQFVVDCRAITDAQMARLRERLGDAGLVQLTMALAMWDGVYRVALTLPAFSPD